MPSDKEGRRRDSDGESRPPQSLAGTAGLGILLRALWVFWQSSGRSRRGSGVTSERASLLAQTKNRTLTTAAFIHRNNAVWCLPAVAGSSKA